MVRFPDWQSADFPEAAFRRGWWGWRRRLSVNPWYRYYEIYRNFRSTLQLVGLGNYKKPAGEQATPRTVTGKDAVLVIGNLGASDGLSRGAHYHLAQIRALHDNVTVRHVSVHDGEDRTLQGSLDQDFDRLYLLDPPSRYSRLLRQVDPVRIASARRVGLWVRETNYLPRFWVRAAAFLDEIWTPSEFSAELLRAGIGGTPIAVVPHAATRTPTPDDELPPAPRLDRHQFNGVAIMDLRGGGARKNPWAVIAAWQRAFSTDPQCRLLMKVRFSRQCRLVREELELMIGDGHNIDLLDAFLPDVELDAIMNAADVFVSLHRSEGYGLPVEEALARDIPVVATDWSATTEFAASYPNYFPVHYRMSPAHNWAKHQPGLDFSWAEASVVSAADHLKAIHRAWLKNNREPSRG